MASIKTVTTLVGTEASFATKHMETLFGKFERMRSEKLQSRSKLPQLLNQESEQSHRVFVRIYYISTKTDQPA